MKQEKTWRVSFTVPPEMAAATEAWADTHFSTYSAFEQPDLSATFDLLVFGKAPNEAALNVCLAVIAKTTGSPTVTVESAEVPAADWRAVTYEAFPPMRIGRFVIHGSHHKRTARWGALGLQIDAATAFGTGEHPTTAGCLKALEIIKKNRARPRRVLDVGTGSGILAMAAVRLWRVPIVATDSDAEAVRVSRQNSIDNGLAGAIDIIHTGRLNHRDMVAGGPYDLVVANILARPLISLSRDMARLVAPGGTV
ncbi:MAG: 50S ribosomal protein L11 methyltransferase, partial [Pseudomonadota bacterium]